MPRIITDGHDHRTPVRGDRGIQFEARSAGDPAPDFVELMPEA